MVSSLALIIGGGLLLFLFVPNVKEKVTQTLNSIKIPTVQANLGGFSTEFQKRVAAVNPLTQSGQFIQQVDTEGKPIRSI